MSENDRDFVAVLDIKNFNTDGEPAEIAQDWKNWMSSFKIWIQAMEDLSDRKKQAMLLHLAGRSVQRVYRALSRGREKEMNYTTTVELLNTHFGQTKNVTLERYEFNKLVQRSGELVDQWVHRLRKKAATCDFGEMENQIIRDFIVNNCRSTSFKRELLMQRDLTLEDTLQIAKNFECVQETVTTLEGSKTNQENVLGKHLSPRFDNIKCYNCGKSGHMRYAKICPAKNNKCENCGKLGHFPEKCYKKKSLASNGKCRKRDVNFAEELGQQEFVLSLYNSSKELLRDSISLVIGGVEVNRIVIDTGATCNIMNKNTWKYLKKSNVKATTKKDAPQVYTSYGHTEALPALGTFTAEIESKDTGRKCRENFIVVDQNSHNLLGKKTSLSLDLVRIGPRIVKLPEKPIRVSLNDKNCF